MRRLVWLVALLMLSTTAGASAQSGEVPEGSVSWLSTGDSYSSGEGVFGNEGDCAQTRNAWGPLTADKLRPMGWTIGPEAFTACTGLLVEHFFNASDKAASLFEWGLEQGVPARTDIITLSFGGNDIGFPDLIKDCLDQDSWFVIWSGCDFSEVDVQERINALLDPPLTDCVGGRVINLVDADPYLCDLWIGPDLANRGSYIDFLVQLAENHLTDRGRIYLAGYPAIVAPNSEWDSWNVYACAGILQGDAEHLGRIATYFDTSLRIAVGQANRELGEERIVYVSRLDLFRDGSHELCGTGGEWLNGISNNRDQTGSMRWEGSFHPNAKGHIGTADYLTQIINLPTVENPPSNRYSLAGLDMNWPQLPDTAAQNLGPENALVSGCTPGTSSSLPDGVWYGFVHAWDEEGVDFDLACLFGPDEYDFLLFSNTVSSARGIRWSPKPIVHSSPFGGEDCREPLVGVDTIPELIATHACMVVPFPGDPGPEVLVFINGGVITEIKVLWHD